MPLPSAGPGQILGHYRIVEQIGAGGMGVVYRAHDERLDRDVALKVLPSGALTDEAARKRFRSEALTLSKLNNPNIAQVYDFDAQDGTDFLVMEYVTGITLVDKIGRKSLPETEVIAVGEQIAHAIEDAHDRGIVHRDLKPSNVMITSKGQVKVLDFGVAKLLRPHEADITESLAEGWDKVAGTLPYMAPEQLLGGSVDVRADIYAVGNLLYEMATAYRPFSERLPTALANTIINKKPAAPSKLNPNISPSLNEIILKCLEKMPEHRYQSARELAIDLHRLGAPPVVSPRAPKYSIDRRRGLKTAVLVIGVVSALLIVLKIVGRKEQRVEHDTTGRIQSLAVLPLANLSGDPSQEYFADGMTEELISSLATVGSLRVISRTSIMHYKRTQETLPQIARELNIDAVIEGSVLRSGDRVRITAQLIDARTDQHLWAQTYDRDLRDVLDLQSEVTQAVVTQIKVKLSALELARLRSVHVVNPLAHDAYLKGNYLGVGTYNQRKRAREYFEQAVRLDTNYAAAFAGLSDSYWNNVDLPPKKAMPKAKEYALKAIAIDGGLPHAHAALASVLFYGDWNWVDADYEFKRALDLNPNDAETHRMYSVYLSAMGRFVDALGEIQHAQNLDPLTAYSNTTAGWVLYCARKYDKALEQCQKAIELAPNYDGAHACLSYSYLGKGDYIHAIEESQRALTLSGGDTVREVWLGRSYAEAGRKADAQKVIQHLTGLSNATYIPPYFIATLHVASNEKEQAFYWLNKAYAERDLYLAWLKVDQAVDPLRSDPRFDELLRQVGFSNRSSVP